MHYLHMKHLNVLMLLKRIYPINRYKFYFPWSVALTDFYSRQSYYRNKSYCNTISIYILQDYDGRFMKYLYWTFFFKSFWNNRVTSKRGYTNKNSIKAHHNIQVFQFNCFSAHISVLVRVYDFSSYEYSILFGLRQYGKGIVRG